MGAGARQRTLLEHERARHRSSLVREVQPLGRHVASAERDEEGVPRPSRLLRTPATTKIYYTNSYYTIFIYYYTNLLHEFEFTTRIYYTNLSLHEFTTRIR